MNPTTQKDEMSFLDHLEELRGHLFRSLWAVLNRIDKEHFDAAIRKTGEPRWVKTVGHERLRTQFFTPADGPHKSRSVTDILYLYEKKLNE